MRYLLLLIIPFFAACTHVDADDKPIADDTLTKTEKGSDMNDAANKLKEAPLTVTGTVVFKTMEGGFYGLDADNGKKYLPHGLPLEYRKNGLVVEVTGSIEKEMMSFQQYGDILKIKTVKVLDDSKVKQENYY